MMTTSGVIVTPDAGTPSMSDIATALVRMPRFGGHTLAPWTVADHSRLVTRMVQQEHPPAACLALLLHDAHEALTGDIPTTFKTQDMRAVQQRLDARIYERHHPEGAQALVKYANLIHDIDRRALLVEARMIGPTRDVSTARFRELFGEEPQARDVDHWYPSLEGTTPAGLLALYFELRFEHERRAKTAAALGGRVDCPEYHVSGSLGRVDVPVGCW